MDILVLILLFALYVLPEVLRHARKPKTYQYPQVPTGSTNEASSKPSIRNPLYCSQTSTMSPPVQTGISADQTSHMNQSLPIDQPVEFSNLAYGLVMAEILGPPRSRNSIRSRR